MINIHHRLKESYEDFNYHSRRSYPGGGIYSILDSIRLVLQVLYFNTLLINYSFIYLL